MREGKNMNNMDNVLFELNKMCVKVSHTGKTILENISLSLEKGRNICIMGESGSGKTTLVNHISDFKKDGLIIKNPSGEEPLKIDRAKVTVFSVCQDADFFLDPYKTLFYYVKRAFLTRNRNLHKGSRNIVDMGILLDFVIKIGLLKPLFEDNGKYTVEEIDRISKKGNDNEKRALWEILADTLKSKTKEKLSGGEKQKFFLLLGLIVNPDILIADEIFTDIDDISRQRISDQIFNKDFTVIFISHDIGLVEKLVDMKALSRVYYLNNGSLHRDTWANSANSKTPEWALKMIRSHNNLLRLITENTTTRKEIGDAQTYKIIKARKVFHDWRMLNFDCRDGHIHLKKGLNYAFIGENGAGKTTLFKILTKICEYDSGNKIFYFIDNELKDLSKVSRLDFVLKNQLVFQKTGNAVDDKKPIMEYLLNFFKKHQRENGCKRIRELTGTFFNPEKVETVISSRFYDLSVGEQRRIMLIQALLLVESDGILFIDEAMRGMDVFLKEILVNHIKKSNQQVFLITHDNVLVRALCDEYVLFEYERKSGKTFLSGPFKIDRLKESYRSV